MKKKVDRPNVSTMYAFGRGCGHPFRQNDGDPSAYAKCSKTLEKIGHPRLPEESHKSHCTRMVDVIRQYAKGYRKPRNGSRVDVKPPQTPLLPEGCNPASHAFLTSYEWRRVRMIALKKYGAVCQCCGASPKTGAVINVDHIKPRKLFPQLALDVDNLQVLCNECNHGKGNWDTTDWRPSESAAA